MAMYYSSFIFIVNCYFTQTYEDEYELLNFGEHKQKFQILKLTVMWQGIDVYNFQAYICCSKWFVVSKESVVLHRWESETKIEFYQTSW